MSFIKDYVLGIANVIIKLCKKPKAVFYRLKNAFRFIYWRCSKCGKIMFIEEEFYCWKCGGDMLYKSLKESEE